MHGTLVHNMKIIFAAAALALFALALASFGGFALDPARAAEGDNVSGWAWSDNTGWISFYGNNYGVDVNETTGAFSGYAWSDAIGWIDFSGPLADGESARPESPNTGAILNFTDNTVSGWARACSVFQIGCAGTLKSDTALGGWDGWLKMHDVTLDTAATPNAFSGWAWGGVPVGWVDMTGVVYGGAPMVTTVPSVTLSAPANVTSGAPFSVAATIKNLAGGTCTDTGSTNDWWNDSVTIPDDNEEITVPISGITTETVYTLACGGTSALPITVGVDPFITSFTANGYSSATYIEGGTPVTLAWNTANASDGDSCSITPAASVTPPGLSGSVGVSPSAETTFILSCTGTSAFSNSPQRVTVHYLSAGFTLEPPRHEIKITTIGKDGVGTGGTSDKAVFHVIADSAVNNVALTVTEDPLAVADPSYGLARGTNYFYKFRIVPTADNTNGVASDVFDATTVNIGKDRFWDDGYEIEFWVESTVPLPPVSQNHIVVHGVSGTATADVNINLDSRAFNPEYREI